MKDNFIMLPEFILDRVKTMSKFNYVDLILWLKNYWTPPVPWKYSGRDIIILGKVTIASQFPLLGNF